jgi:hypothetical protein
LENGSGGAKLLHTINERNIMLLVLTLIRKYIGGKTEFTFLVAFILTILFIAPIPFMAWLTAGVYTKILLFMGTFAGSALLSRIEDKKGLGPAFLSLIISLARTFKKVNP